MTIDLDMGIPYMPDGLPEEERRRVERENRRLFILGGAMGGMGGMGSYMGPVYPFLPGLPDDEEVDPNP